MFHVCLRWIYILLLGGKFCICILGHLVNSVVPSCRLLINFLTGWSIHYRGRNIEAWGCKESDMTKQLNWTELRKVELATYKLHAYLQSTMANIFRLIKRKLRAKRNVCGEEAHVEGSALFRTAELNRRAWT